MKITTLKALVLASTFLAAPAFAQVIDSKTFSTKLTASQVICESNLPSYTSNDTSSTISLELANSDLKKLPVLVGHNAIDWKEGLHCHDLSKIVGPIAADGTVKVKVTRLLQKSKNFNSYICMGKPILIETIDIEFSTGVKLQSYASKLLDTTGCNLFE